MTGVTNGRSVLNESISVALGVRNEKCSLCNDGFVVRSFFGQDVTKFKFIAA